MSEKERLSPPLVFFLYMASAFVLVFAYRWFFPGNISTPLKIFRLRWHLFSTAAACIALFPALAFSALVIPFGLKEHSEGGYAGGTFVGNKGFSPQFLRYITWPVITAAIAAALYGVLFFVALPLADNARITITEQTELYASALEQAKKHASAREWTEASQFLAICERIWPGNEETAKLKGNFSSGFSSYQRFIEETRANADETIPEGQPVNAVEAMSQAEQAFARERWYDAHWLATLAARLAEEGSAQRGPALALAAQAWNKISGLEPNAQEQERFDLYRLKQDGYMSMLANDWINAYYIFKELSDRTPNDPDVKQYLENSTRGLSETAFFMDEIDLALGGLVRDPVFSLPGELPLFDENAGNGAGFSGGGRMILRFSRALLHPEYAYAWDPELVAVDQNGAFLYRAAAAYGKVIPAVINAPGGKTLRQAALLLRALDRTDRGKTWEPAWTDEQGEPLPAGQIEGAAAGPQILLNLSYDDFLLLVETMRGIDGLSLRELWTAEKRLPYYGYAAGIFRTEALRRLAEPVFFLPMTVLVLLLGWRYRARKKPRYVYLPMLCALPLVFYGVLSFYRTVINSLAIWLSFTVSFQMMLVYFIAGSALIFIAAVILLAAQHG